MKGREVKAQREEMVCLEAQGILIIMLAGERGVPIPWCTPGSRNAPSSFEHKPPLSQTKQLQLQYSHYNRVNYHAASDRHLPHSGGHDVHSSSWPGWHLAEHVLVGP